MKRGFTLIELLIALGLSALIFVTVSSLLVTLLTSNTKSRRQEMFEQVKNDLTAEFFNTVRWADTVSGESGQLVVDGVTYELDGGRLNRDGLPITPVNVEVQDFAVTDLSAAEGLASVRIEAQLVDRNFNLAQDRLVVVVSQRRTTIGGDL